MLITDIKYSYDVYTAIYHPNTYHTGNWINESNMLDVVFKSHLVNFISCMGANDKMLDQYT